MGDTREQERQAKRTQRAEHVSDRLVLYMLILAVGCALFSALHLELLPMAAWSGWGAAAAVCALLFGILLVWVSEHRRTA
ncbi:hypothetical protein [Falsiroseomonas sp. HW251]|uniref:hypothetical protein n=1 Tax=Falsiroseomonas sp. HW251 TaxID=3390998 RepID=UPI003D31858A